MTTANRVVSHLWPLVLANGGPRPTALKPILLTKVFDDDWLHDLTLPLNGGRDPGQDITLVEGFQFSRGLNDREFDEEYRQQPRTRVYEGFDVRSDGWFSLAAAQFARLASCRVVSSVYQSTAGDATMGEHWDAWYGLIVQLLGEKVWYIRQTPEAKPEAVTVRQGDVLLLPENVRHDVSTPRESVHMVFAMITGQSFK